MKLKEILSNYWEIVFSFLSALISSYESVNNLLQLGWVTNDKVSDVFHLLFIFFGCLGIWKFVKKAHEAERLCMKWEEKAQKELENARKSERLYKELQIAYANQEKQLEAIRVNVGTANKSLLGNQINNSTINITDPDKEQSIDEEITFPRTHLHQEFHIKKDSAQNVLNFIRNDISSGLWHIMEGDKISYSVNYQETKFSYPDKDNTPVHGAFFSVIKDGKHFSKLFWISIISSGIGENTLLTVNFETQEKNAVGFFNVMRKRLVKHFIIWEPMAGAW